MTIKNRAGSCGCCGGCDLFAITDLLTETTDVSTIDGFKVYGVPLDVPGLWNLIIGPKFTGNYITTPAPKITFRLLKADNSVFAEWYHSRQVVVRSGINDWVYKNNFSWNGSIAFDDTRHIQQIAATTFTNSNFEPHSIVSREDYASTTGLIISDVIEDFDISGANPSFADEDETLRNNLYLGGTSLPFSAAIATATGPLRIGVKGDPGSGNSFTVSVTAVKVRQEGIICLNGYGDSVIVQEEKNLSCEPVSVCIVTYPHYTTPIWEVVDATSDVTLASTEILTEIGISCRTFHRYGAIEELSSVVLRPLHTVGQKVYNAADIGLPFIIGASNSDPRRSQICWEYDYIGLDYLASSYTQGTGPTFRTANFPFNVTTTVFATSDPCEFKVRCDFRIDAYYPFPQTDTSHSGSIKSSGFCYPDNPQSPSLSGSRWLPNYGFNTTLTSNEPELFARFERVVAAWPHEPPTINFTSADLVGSSETWKILTGFTNAVLYDGAATPQDMTYSVDFVLTSVATNSIAFTLRAHSAPRVPHP